MACPFEECDGSTWLLDETTGDARPCRCREQRMRKAVSGGIGTGIGRRFLEVSFDREPIVSLDPMVLRQVRTFVRSIGEHLDSGRGLWFDGPVGTGKTSLAILVAKAAKDAGRSYAVYPVPRLLAEIKRTFDRDASDTYLDFFRRLCTVDVLRARRPGRREADRVGARAALLDRQRALAGPAIDGGDDQHPGRGSGCPGAAASASVRDLRDATTSGRMDGRDLDDLRRIVDRLEQVTARVADLDPDSSYDPILRLRRQIGARTVSRLVEICDDPIPIMGPDLRMAAQGA